VLGVDRDDLRPGGLCQCGDQLAADDQRLLVGQRQVDPLGERDDRRAEAGAADDRVEHQIRVRRGHELDQALRAGEHLALCPRLRGARRDVGVRERDPAHAVSARLRDQRLVGRAGREAHDLERITRAGDDVERLGADRPGRPEDEEPLHRRPIVATPI
jgi:hypothetical protein